MLRIIFTIPNSEKNDMIPYSICYSILFLLIIHQLQQMDIYEQNIYDQVIYNYMMSQLHADRQMQLSTISEPIKSGHDLYENSDIAAPDAKRRRTNNTNRSKSQGK